jgi:hypothetical protein
VSRGEHEVEGKRKAEGKREAGVRLIGHCYEWGREVGVRVALGEWGKSVFVGEQGREVMFARRKSHFWSLFCFRCALHVVRGISIHSLIMTAPCCTWDFRACSSAPYYEWLHVHVLLYVGFPSVRRAPLLN